MLEHTRGPYSKVDFESSLEALDYYSKKARLLHKINLCIQMIEAGLSDNKAELELELSAYQAELELLPHPSSKD